jgi:hypothetical protein
MDSGKHVADQNLEAGARLSAWGEAGVVSGAAAAAAAASASFALYGKSAKSIASVQGLRISTVRRRLCYYSASLAATYY